MGDQVLSKRHSLRLTSLRQRSSAEPGRTSQKEILTQKRLDELKNKSKNGKIKKKLDETMRRSPTGKRLRYRKLLYFTWIVPKDSLLLPVCAWMDCIPGCSSGYSRQRVKRPEMAVLKLWDDLQWFSTESWTRSRLKESFHRFGIECREIETIF